MRSSKQVQADINKNKQAREKLVDSYNKVISDLQDNKAKGKELYEELQASWAAERETETVES